MQGGHPSSDDLMQSTGSNSSGPLGVGMPIPGPRLEEHVLRLGHRNLQNYTGYEEEYLILE